MDIGRVGLAAVNFADAAQRHRAVGSPAGWSGERGRNPKQTGGLVVRTVSTGERPKRVQSLRKSRECGRAFLASEDRRIAAPITERLRMVRAALTSVARIVACALCALALGLPSAAQVKNGFDLRGSVIDAKLIEHGGPGRDGIPAIDSPDFVSAQSAEASATISDDDRVIGVAYAGISKAYPLKILDWHEVVNDRFGAERMIVTYCPLCGTGMVFKPSSAAPDSTFGVSGLLYNSDVLLYDRATNSLWSQILGRAVSGPLKGTELESLPSRHTTWRAWKAAHPTTLVLSPRTGYRRNYSVSPYLGYASSPRLMFTVEHVSQQYQSKDLVLGVTVGGESKAYPLRELYREPGSTLVDVVGGKTLTIKWSEADQTAHATDVSGRDVESVLAYWFAWYAFHPDTAVFRAATPNGR